MLEPSMHLPLASDAPDDRFDPRVRAAQAGEPLRAAGITTFQINVGKLCNQACRHCHVDAGPNRTERMDGATIDRCLDLIARHRFPIVDITGGAPELNPHFRRLVTGARASGARVMVRHNLTVMSEPGQEDLPAFFLANGVEVVSSLPHYTADATDRQRGRGVFARSIDALRALNAAGFGSGDPQRPLDLVYNPVGSFLPGIQSDLERDYKRELSTRWSVTFDHLLALTNMPIQRFRDWLVRTGQLDEYQQSLESAFNPAAIAPLMCRSTISVSWDGRLYDCDFNQMLELPVRDAPATLADFDLARLAQRRIVTANHCFGCTAGAGSSCGGQTA